MTEERKKRVDEEIEEEDLKKVAGGEIGGVEHTDTWSGEGAATKRDKDGLSK